ncbi:hypothetical protein R6Z07F_019635 [Ovis aries]
MPSVALPEAWSPSERHLCSRNSEESLDFMGGPCGYAENGSGVIQIGKRLSSHAASRTGILPHVSLRWTRVLCLPEFCRETQSAFVECGVGVRHSARHRADRNEPLLEPQDVMNRCQDHQDMLYNGTRRSGQIGIQAHQPPGEVDEESPGPRGQLLPLALQDPRFLSSEV